MSDAEIKLLTAKCALLTQINDHKTIIDYHLKEGAKRSRELLQSASQNDNLMTISKKDYDMILNYLLSIESEAIHNIGNNQYLKEYYVQIEIKRDILKTL